MPKELKRNYVMSDAALIQRADALEISITRDATEFADRGVDEDRVAEFTDARDAFSDYPTDPELLGVLEDKTLLKDAARAAFEPKVRDIRSMADVKFKGKGLYKSFKFDDLSELEDGQAVRLGRRVVRVATTLLTQLESEGLSAPKITALTGLTTALDDALDAQEEAKENRDIAAQHRVVLGNDLFAKLVELASIGKAIFQDTDEAKYNDYVIDDSPSGGAPDFSGTVAAGDLVLITTLEYVADNSISFNNTGSTELQFGLRVALGTPAGTPLTVPAGATLTHTMAELNSDATATKLVVFNTDDEADGTYEVNVD